MKRRFRVAALAAAVVMAILFVPGSRAEAREDSLSRPILFIHGIDPAAEDPLAPASVNCGMWDPMISSLRASGHSAAMHKLRYYQYDYNCTASFAATDQNTSIATLGYHLAWWIYNNYTYRGIPVDIVGHSMGGLIARSAIAQSLGRGSGPPVLYVEDVVTMATPHLGSDMARWGCHHRQCDEMQPNSTFLTTLPQNPQGTGGTQWTLIGSDSDWIAGENTSVGMAAFRKVVYEYPDYGHSDLYNDTSRVEDADARWWNGSQWMATDWAPRPVRWADYALTYGSW